MEITAQKKKLFYRRPLQPIFYEYVGGRRCRYRMVVGFITTYAISAYHH
jgi:hypothetical protein